MTCPASWPALTDLTARTLLALPGDGLLDVLTPRSTLAATWLLPTRLLLELGGAPPGARPALVRAGWRTSGPRAGTLVVGATRPELSGDARREVAGHAAHEVVGLLRVDPDDVELFVPGCPPPAHRVPAQEVLW